MISLQYIEDALRNKFARGFHRGLHRKKTLWERFVSWLSFSGNSTNQRIFVLRPYVSPTFTEAITAIRTIFPGYDLFIGDKGRDDIYQRAAMNAQCNGNKLFWFTASNGLVEVEIQLLIIENGDNVIPNLPELEVTLLQRNLEQPKFRSVTKTA